MGNLADLKERYGIKVESRNDIPKEDKPRSPNRRRPWLFKEEDHKDNSMRNIRRQSRKEEVSFEDFKKYNKSRVFTDEDDKQKNERYKSKRKDKTSYLDVALPDEDDRIVVDTFYETEDESVIISENYEMDLKSELLAKEARIKELEAMIAKLEAQNGPLEAPRS